MSTGSSGRGRRNGRLANLSIGFDFDTADLARGLAAVSTSLSRLGVQATRSLGTAFGQAARSGERAVSNLSRVAGRAFSDIARSSERTFGHVARSGTQSLGHVTRLLGNLNRDWTRAMSSIMRGGGGGGLFGSMLQGGFMGAGFAAFQGFADTLTAPFRNIGQAILDSSDIEVTERKFANVFGNMTKSADKFAKEYAAKIGQSATDVKEHMARMQDTLVPAGFNRGSAAKMTETMTKLATDLAANEGISIGESMQRIISGISGNHEALRLFAVNITEATLKQKLFSMGVKGGIQAATEQQKILARMNILLEKTRDAHGMAGKAAGTFASELGGFNAMLTQVSGSVGNAFKPAATEILKFFREGLSGIDGQMGDLQAWGKVLGEATKNALKNLDPLREQFKELAASAVASFGELAKWMKFASMDKGNAQETWTAGVEMFKSLGIKAVAGIGGALAGVIGVSGEEIKAIFKDVSETVASILEAFQEMIKASRSIRLMLGPLMPTFTGDLMGTISDADSAIQNTIDKLRGKNPSQDEILKKGGKPEKPKTFFERMMDGMRKGLEGAQDAGVDKKLNDLTNKRDEALKNAPPDAPKDGKAEKYGKIDPRTSMGRTLDALTNGLQKAIGNFGRDLSKQFSKPQEPTLRDKMRSPDGKSHLKNSKRSFGDADAGAVLAGIGQRMWDQLGVMKQRPQVQFGSIDDMQKNLQSKLGGESEQDKLRMEIMKQQKDAAVKTVEELQKVPKKIGEALGPILSSLGLT